MVRNPTGPKEQLPFARPSRTRTTPDRTEEGLRMGKLVVMSLVAFGLLAPAAQAAPPPNDDRGNAQALAVPSTVRGTTVDATSEGGEPFTCAGPPDHSAWYAIAASG